MIKIVALLFSLLFTNWLTDQNNPQTLLWEVSKKRNAHKSYLFGTFHEVDPGFFDKLTIAVEKLKQSNLVFIEQKSETNKGTETEGKLYFWNREKWNNLLTESQKSIFDSFSQKAQSDIYYQIPSIILLRQLSGLYLQNFCDTLSRTSHEIMDYYIEKLALKNNQTVKALDINQQTILVNTQAYMSSQQDLVAAEQCIKLMSQMLNNIDTGCTIINDYKNMNLNYELGLDISNKMTANTLLIERNSRWISILNQGFKTQPCFVAVGFRHLFYKQGLIS